MAELISFDIDGTLEVGDPPGCIDMEMGRKAKENGYIIGSCSDRTVTNQKRIWSEQGIEVAFTVVKHQLESVKELFEAEQYYHCLLYTSPSPRDLSTSRMPSSA